MKFMVMNKNKQMRRCAAIGIRFVVFVLFLSLLLYGVNRTLTPKYEYANSNVPTTSTYRGFYDMERNTVDVLLLGSSHMACGISPQDMYDAAGIRSYNLANSLQPAWISYFWLKEALQYQSPRVVVLDCYYLFYTVGVYDTPTRTALDEMREGTVKMEAAKALASMEGGESELSYHFAAVRFHSRWSQLEEEDFTWAEEKIGRAMKGLYRAWDVCGVEDFAPIEPDPSDASVIPEEFDALQREYLDKIVDLCEEERIELVLIKTPSASETLERNAAIRAYAEEHGLTFYDFNEKVLYDEIDFNIATDMWDFKYDGEMNAHANPSGALKMSTFLANALIGVNGLEPVSDSQWEESRQISEYCWQDFVLPYAGDLLTYLGLLDQDRYSIFIAAKDDASSSLTQDVVDAMQSLGFTFDLMDHYRYSYVAIRNGDEITEILSEEEISVNGALRGGRVPYFVTSSGFLADNSTSIEIDGEEYSVNSRGLNIVVYDNEMHDVIDSVCFDTYDSAWTASR